MTDPATDPATDPGTTPASAPTSPAAAEAGAPIVVGLGSNGSPSAVALGVRVARLLGAPLHLVHVVEPLVAAPEVAVLAELDVEAAGAEVLGGALAELRAQDPDLSVSGVVLLGHPVTSLVRATTEARMVVLEHRDLPTLARLVIRSVTGGVAAKARIPVLSVPEGWHSVPGGAVTVAIDDPATAHPLVRLAAVAAHALESELRVLNVWSLPTAYEGVRLTPEDDATLAETSHHEISQLLRESDVDLSTLKVTVQVVRGRPVDALLEASKASALLVLGRHDPARGLGSHLGPVARSVFRAGHSPVMLVDLHSS